ncbi:hypothetical protein DLJ47_06825 [Micromonospora sp. S4605]|nr:hypothetical protein DLJ47_06825 [Micromonospora sp. S4605]
MAVGHRVDPTRWRSLGERAGHDDPQAMQRLLRAVVWETGTAMAGAGPACGSCSGFITTPA